MSTRDLAVSVRGLSKAYTLRHNATRHNTMGESLLHRLLHPFEKPEMETFWALQDVSFDVYAGDVVGLIGRNGAGKSTLLKLLSRITEPTKGQIDLFGRVGSLLEVGTGFHPELTGRENIYLNGAILGMTRREIDHSFDAIVDFSGTERFLDTPVKRYSSGMYVRLAFAVAAHLNPEILIVDEVLAVGDAEFQKKCLGKMQDVSQSGRTILFVSHNMAAVRQLCNRAVYLQSGKVLLDAGTEAVINTYLSEDAATDAAIVWSDPITAPGTEGIRFLRAAIRNDLGRIASTIDSRKPFVLELEYEITAPMEKLKIGFMMQNSGGMEICGSNDEDLQVPFRMPGRYVTRCVFPGYVLNEGQYQVLFGADTYPFEVPLVRSGFCIAFSIEDVEGHGFSGTHLPGVVRPLLDWKIEVTEGLRTEAGHPEMQEAR
jgi:lipopolysaccharide transport system ATP-binding protein